MIPVGIANSSPLIALGRIGRLDLLDGQFERLIVPKAVAAEVGEIPSWISIESVGQPRTLTAFPPRIHAGEAEVILLGIQHPGSILILDDWYAREFARMRGLTVLGTVGLLLRAKRVGRLAKVIPILDELTQAGFHLSAQVMLDVKKLAGES